MMPSSMILFVFDEYFTNTDIRLGFFKASQKGFKHAGFYPVIRIDKTDILAFCFPEAQIACSGKTFVFRMKNPDPIVASSILIANLTAFVRRSVIDQKDFNILICLLENTVNTLMKVWFDFINRNYNAYHFF